MADLRDESVLLSVESDLLFFMVLQVWRRHEEVEENNFDRRELEFCGQELFLRCCLTEMRLVEKS